MVATTLALLLVFLTPLSAAAEVMDKEPTLAAIWIWCATTVLVGVISYANRYVVGVSVTTPGTLYMIAAQFELWDPHVGPAIVREAGASYVLQAYAATLVVVVVHTFGVVMACRRCALRATPPNKALEHL